MAAFFLLSLSLTSSNFFSSSAERSGISRSSSICRNTFWRIFIEQFGNNSVVVKDSTHPRKAHSQYLYLSLCSLHQPLFLTSASVPYISLCYLHQPLFLTSASVPHLRICSVNQPLLLSLCSSSQPLSRKSASAS